MRFRRWVEEQNQGTVWHATDIDSANDILRNGFKPKSSMWEEPSLINRSGRNIQGVWVSTNKFSAMNLLGALQKMNWFQSLQEVEDFWADKGVDHKLLANIRSDFEKGKRSHPGHFYLDINQEVGTRVAGNMWLWNDLARKLVGKEVVAVKAHYPFTKQGGGGIESGQFVKDVHNLVPERIITNPVQLFDP